MMTIVNAHSLVKPNSNYGLNIELGNPLGEGVQGAVYAIEGTDKVVKLYSSPDKSHVVPLVSYLCNHKLNEAHPSLAALPYDVFEASDGTLGIMMNCAPGQSIDQLGFKLLKTHGLNDRLALAYQLAKGVAILHAKGVIVADLADANIHYDEAHNNLFVIDIDGGGIMNGRGYQLKPTVSGHDYGSLMPLELRNPNNLPTFASDNWALAVISHQITSTPSGADPFFFGQNNRVLSGRELWPPPLHTIPDKLRPHMQQHARGLAALGRGIVGSFKNTFGTMGRNHPEYRVKASQWSDMFERAGRWVYRCPNCGQEFVAEQKTHCPYCPNPINHAQFRADGCRAQLMCREPMVITRYQLGLGNSREPVLQWQRHYSNIMVRVLSGVVHVKFSKQCHSVCAGQRYEFGKGFFSCRFSEHSTHEARFTLSNPKGYWVNQSPKAKIARPFVIAKGQII